MRDALHALCVRAVRPKLFWVMQAAKPDAIATLSALPGVMVIPVTPELKMRQEHSRIWNETWLAAFFHKPCNHELFVHQSLNMEGPPAAACRESQRNACRSI